MFGEESTQEQVYAATSEHLVREVMQGYNGTILAYGQTGSGKTYSMMGQTSAPHLPGIVPRCLEAILGQAHADKTKDYLVMCSFLELYNEELRDLLRPAKKLELR